MIYIILWFIIGIICSLTSIFVFRRDGTTNRQGELYLATIGPLFGPIVGILLIIDILKRFF